MLQVFTREHQDVIYVDNYKVQGSVQPIPEKQVNNPNSIFLCEFRGNPDLPIPWREVQGWEESGLPQLVQQVINSREIWDTYLAQ